MCTSSRIKSLAAPRIVVLLALGSGLSTMCGKSIGQTPDNTAEPARKVGRYEEADRCIDCHLRPLPTRRKSLNFVLLTEYSIWKTHDKHAQAYATLRGRRAKQMAEILGVKDVREPKVGCMGCHAMSNAFGERSLKELDKKPPDGVSCGGCHGPSRGWLGPDNKPTNQGWYAPHSDPDHPEEWRLLPPVDKVKADKAKLGFIDLRDPETRATSCLSCHIGNTSEGKVVTHAMFAAGHPPLPPIEIATFSKNQPQHWRDAKKVPLFLSQRDQLRSIYHFNNVDFQRTEFALIGTIVALRETMKLVCDRANMKAKNPRQLWPELLFGQDNPEATDLQKWQSMARDRWPEIATAHLDCFSCHHDLNSPGYRQERGFGYQLSGRLVRTVPGRPLIRAWPMALVELSIAHTGKTERLNDLAKKLEALVATSKTSPFGNPEEIADAAQALVCWCNEVIADLKGARYDETSAWNLLLTACDLYSASESKNPRGRSTPFLPDYEAARQIVSLLDVVYEEWRPKGKKLDDIKMIMRKLADQVDLHPYTKRQARLEVILRDVIMPVVQKSSKEQSKKQLEQIEKDLEKFSVYLQHMDDEDALKQLADKNDYLDAVGNVPNEDFTNGLLKKDVIKKLQDLSDAELTKVLETVAGYKPKVFQEHLKTLASLLKSRRKR